MTNSTSKPVLSYLTTLFGRDTLRVESLTFSCPSGHGSFLFLFRVSYLEFRLPVSLRRPENQRDLVPKDLRVCSVSSDQFGRNIPVYSLNRQSTNSLLPPTHRDWLNKSEIVLRDLDTYTSTKHYQFSKEHLLSRHARFCYVKPILERPTSRLKERH